MASRSRPETAVTAEDHHTPASSTRVKRRRLRELRSDGSVSCASECTPWPLWPNPGTNPGLGVHVAHAVVVGLRPDLHGITEEGVSCDTVEIRMRHPSRLASIWYLQKSELPVTISTKPRICDVVLWCCQFDCCQ